ncbi:aminotransferase class I/II-fold pyridoxal phosphate-dependent enzyme [Cohnella kolymensis]|uniref:aminotransferase class I/II-fold pyridoxal phosphate-dependent enzyme n=1 Tax=Cohnella kolymensis TaxID=1590652 RepID=UPI000696FD60|nr:PLP-dependent aminotransferase family protein [Cohnella kolymensis]
MSPIINWMGGWPKEGLVSGADWEERLTVAAKEAVESAVNRAPERLRLQAEQRLRAQLAAGLLKHKTGGDEQLLMLTSGADAGLAWLLEKLLTPGDVILTEHLTSRAALHAFRKADMQVKAVQGDEEGMHPDALSAAIHRERPRMVYISAACTDPEGRSWSPERKKKAAQACRESGVLLVTDDRQEMLLYDNDGCLEKPEPGSLSIGQLPPGLIAGFRFGWIAGSSIDIMPAAGKANFPVEHLALSRLLDTQPLEPLIEMLRVQCAERLRQMTEQLRRCGQPDLMWTSPKGGLHLWLHLPSGLDGESLLRAAWLKGLIFQPGAPFYAANPHKNTLRLTHAFADERQIKLGVTRLSESIEEFTGRWSRS